MKRAGTARRGIYMSDGTVNVALAQEGDREGEDRHLSLRHVGRRSRRGREEGRRRGRDLSRRPADLAELVLRGEIPRSARHRVRPHPQGLGRRRQGRGSPSPDRADVGRDAARDRHRGGAGRASASRCGWRSRASPACVVEALGDDNFLEQVPRAGTNHPATLELFDAIGLYERLEPRGIIAPLFHYWDRHDNRLIAEFDHAHLEGRHALSLRAAMRAHQDRRGGAGARQGASADRRAPVDEFHGVRAERRRRDRPCDRPGRRDRRRSRAPIW